jgi:hypothetical protein
LTDAGDGLDARRLAQSFEFSFDMRILRLILIHVHEHGALDRNLVTDRALGQLSLPAS